MRRVATRTTSRLRSLKMTILPQKTSSPQKTSWIKTTSSLKTRSLKKTKQMMRVGMPARGNRVRSRLMTLTVGWK